MKTAVRITNKTRYATKDLRAWTLAALKHRGALDAKREWSVIWQTARGWSVSGRASIGGRWFRMNIPKPRDERLPPRGKDDILWLKGVLLHEIDHCLGLRDEREMRGAYRIDPEGFVKGFPDLPWPSEAIKRSPPPRGKARPLEIKLKEARARVDLYERREKAAVRLKTKWAAKVRYYERRKTS